MKFALPYPKGKTVMLFLIAFMISCGSRHIVPNTIQIKAENLNQLPVILIPKPVIKRVDTPHYRIQPSRIDPENKAVYTQLVQKDNKIPKNNFDSILSLNMAWQRQFLYSAQRSRVTRIQRDSAYELIQGIRDTLNKVKDETRKARETSKIAKATLTMFDLIIYSCLAICTLNAVIDLFKTLFVRKKSL